MRPPAASPVPAWGFWLWKWGHDAPVIKWLLWPRRCRLAAPGASPSRQPLALAALAAGARGPGGLDAPSQEGTDSTGTSWALLGFPKSIWVTVCPAISIPLPPAVGPALAPKLVPHSCPHPIYPMAQGRAPTRGSPSPPAGRATSLEAGADGHIWVPSPGRGGRGPPPPRPSRDARGSPGGGWVGLAGGRQEEGGHGRGREAVVSFFFNYPPSFAVSAANFPSPPSAFMSRILGPGSGSCQKRRGWGSLPPRVKITWAGEGWSWDGGEEGRAGSRAGTQPFLLTRPSGCPVPGEPRGSLGVPSGVSAHATPMRTEPPGARCP